MIQRRDENGTAEIRIAHEPANVLTVEFADVLPAASSPAATASWPGAKEAWGCRS